MTEKETDALLGTLESLFDVIDRAACQLEALVKHAGLIIESTKEMLGDTKAINKNMFQAQLGLKAIAAGMVFTGDMTPEMKKELEDQIEAKEQGDQPAHIKT